MGNRANYILKTDNEVSIYYTHWRAINVTQDLALGQNEFIKLIQEFDKEETILEVPWIEACVLVDFSQKKLTFWETDLLFETSVREEYLEQLRKIWRNWEIQFAEKEMYDIEQQMQIENTVNEEIKLNSGSLEDLTDSSIDDEDFSCLIILMKNGKHFVRYVNGGEEENITLIGDSIIDKLMSMKERELKKENSEGFYGFFIIDSDNKTLWINQFVPVLKSELKKRWKNWTINVGNFGYIKLLKEIGVNTSELELTKDESKKIVSNYLNQKDTFDPNSFAKMLTKEMGENIKYTKHFFQNIKPKKPL